ncbi:putative fructose-6-phosphate aldolase (FSA) [Sulfitobacter noctilucae]|uniref:transaldolase family protein n=1 Tax=Sulfitobacter noctilucae TaxID=1342302 RepID=UPI000467F72E|nr:transaldolase family protein [Sulfitobacter noctilucae]KIN60669.1 putative fructose-6-phosphate aldolase (FSA) [Sulfitobacter noctilucae]
MTLYLDTANTADWDALMPLGLFQGITTNPLLAARAGLDYPNIAWGDLAGRARDLGATEFFAQVYGPPEGYVDWAGQLYEVGKSAGIETIVKIPLVEDAIRATPAIKELGGRILMTACYDAKQMITAKALGAEFIAPYFGRMMEAGLDGEAHLSTMAAMNRNGGPACRVLVASLRSAEQMVTLAGLGHDCFTIAPAVARDLLSDPLTQKAFEDFETAIRSAP